MPEKCSEECYRHSESTPKALQKSTLGTPSQVAESTPQGALQGHFFTPGPLCAPVFKMVGGIARLRAFSRALHFQMCFGAPAKTELWWGRAFGLLSCWQALTVFLACYCRWTFWSLVAQFCRFLGVLQGCRPISDPKGLKVAQELPSLAFTFGPLSGHFFGHFFRIGGATIFVSQNCPGFGRVLVSRKRG